MDIHDFLQIPDITACKRLLCIQPHPDDNEVGAGATIAKLVDIGCAVTYVTVTDGSLGTLDAATTATKLSETRKRETREAAAALGVDDVRFLDFADGAYTEEKDICRALVPIIREMQPEMVLTVDPFLPYEFHPDHRRCGMASAQACLFSPFPHFLPETHSTWQVSAMILHSSAHPNTFVDVDASWERKLEAIARHASQFPPEILGRLSAYFTAKAEHYAKGLSCQRAEAFKVLPPDCLHMNVDSLAF